MNNIKRIRDKIIDRRFPYLVRYLGKAIVEYNMLKEDDRVLVGISGGKDSLSLLHLLDYHCRHAPFKYEIKACYLDFGNRGLSMDSLRKHLQDYGFEYIIRNCSFSSDEDYQDSDHFWCSEEKRKILLDICRDEGCNKLALGHHLDDIIQRILMEIVFQGKISLSLVKLDFSERGIILIRPMCLIEEKSISRFSEILGFSSGKDSPPCKEDFKKDWVKRIIEGLADDYPYIKRNIFNSLRRIRSNYLL